MSSEQTIACDLTAIADEEREDHKQTSEELFRSVETWKELEQGYAFRLPTATETIEKAGAFIARERLCCPFFNFELDVSTDHGPVWLQITGSDEVKEYISKSVIPQLKSIGDQEEWQLPENTITPE